MHEPSTPTADAVARFHALVDSMPEMVFTATADGACDYANARFYQYTALPPGSAGGDGWQRALHPDDLEPMQRRLRLSIETGDPFEMRCRFAGADASYRWFLGRSRPLLDGSGIVVGWLGTLSEVDELVRHGQAVEAEAQREHDARIEAEAANKAKDDFLATLSHELRSPLSAVLTWCQLLRTGKLDPERSVQALEAIERNARVQVRLIDDMLDGSRIATGKLAFDTQPIDIVAAARRAADAVRADSDGPRQGATIRVIPPGEAAIAATPAAGRIDLSGVRVLIVDDEPDAREFMTTILSACGADVRCAGSALEALDVLQEGRPDVMVSDIGMPDADGYALLRKVRAPDTGDRGLVPAIAVTGYGSPDDRRRALGSGYQLHLTKPFEPEALISAVARLVGRQ